MITKFKDQLAKSNLAKNTVTSYVWTVQYFLNHYEEVNKKNLLTYKGYLVENFKPQTVNLRLQGINKYLEFIKQDKLKVKFVKVQQKNFLENVISDADYKFLKTRLKTDGYDEWYFIVWFMAATGARVSELLHIKAEHVQVGYLDLYSKGGKIRRLYIPKNLRTEAAKWLREKGSISGYIFLNRFGERITTRGIAQQLKHFAEKYGMSVCLMNIGIYGSLFLLYLNLVILFTNGAGFTGPTFGIMLAALTFSAMGQHPRNVLPILIGYQMLYLVTGFFCHMNGRELTWSLSTQGYLNGVAFATGMSPLVGHYGFRVGILSGFLCASMCTATSAVHGGFVLYNGGFTAGITVLILLPILEHYLPGTRSEMKDQRLNMQELLALVQNKKNSSQSEKQP